MERILIEGVVEHGRRLGRELGFPTANLAVPEDVAAADGVYRSRAEVGGKVYDAMSNLGRNPSVGGVERRLETHIFDFRGELYGRRLRTLCTGKKKVQFAGIPTFSPEHFARIEQKDTMKRKQFVKGMEQIAQEGAIQIFREVGGGMEEVVVGVVGVLQLEVLEYRLNTEYNVEIRMQQLPFEQLRWVQNDPDTYNLRDLDLTSDTKAVEDMKGNRLLLFTSDWAVRWAETHNETLKLSEFGNI